MRYNVSNLKIETHNSVEIYKGFGIEAFKTINDEFLIKKIMLIGTELEYAAQTDVGLYRDNNEDAIALCPESALTILADGMGGYNAGEIASDLAVKEIQSFIQQKLPHIADQIKANRIADAAQLIVQAVESANTAIWHAATSQREYYGMGTTLVMTLCQNDNLLVAHVGDSRAYRFRHNQLIQITHDHSVVQEQIDAGLLTPDAAQTSKIKNLVTRAVGVMGNVDVEVHAHKMQVGDIYLLCSDGLSDMVTTQQISDVLQNKAKLQDACDDLVVLANQQGGRDNISVVLFKVIGISLA